MPSPIFHLLYPDYDARVRAMAEQFAIWMATANCDLELQP